MSLLLALSGGLSAREASHTAAVPLGTSSDVDVIVTASHSKAVSLGTSANISVLVTADKSKDVPIGSTLDTDVIVKADHSKAIPFGTIATALTLAERIIDHTSALSIGTTATASFLVTADHTDAVDIGTSADASLLVVVEHTADVPIGTSADATVPQPPGAIRRPPPKGIEAELLDLNVAVLNSETPITLGTTASLETSWPVRVVDGQSSLCIRSHATAAVILTREIRFTRKQRAVQRAQLTRHPSARPLTPRTADARSGISLQTGSHASAGIVVSGHSALELDSSARALVHVLDVPRELPSRAASSAHALRLRSAAVAAITVIEPVSIDSHSQIGISTSGDLTIDDERILDIEETDLHALLLAYQYMTT